MGISWRWDPEVARTIQLEYSGSWTWDDLTMIVRTYCEEIKVLGYATVDIISINQPDTQAPIGVYNKAVHMGWQDVKELNMVIFIGLKPIERATLEAVLQNTPEEPYPHDFADCIDDAREIILKSRRNYARRH